MSETTQNSADSGANAAGQEDQLQQLNAKYLTALADIENLRKRYAREREEMALYGQTRLISALLPVIDNFQLALEAARKHHPEAKAVLDGFGLMVPQLLQVLQGAGVETIEPKAGDVFDPHSHESVGEAADEKIPHHAILSLQRTGYKLADRVLRPAMVMLSSGTK